LPALCCLRFNRSPANLQQKCPTPEVRAILWKQLRTVLKCDPKFWAQNRAHLFATLRFIGKFADFTFLHTVGVAGSKPAARTIFSREIDKIGSPDTILTQIPPENGDDDVSKWPKKVTHRHRVYAKVYRPCAGRDSYRVAWKAAGKRQMKSFRTYSGGQGAKKFADDLVKDLAKQTPVAFLTAAQADDALAAIGLLNNFQADTGRQVSLVTAVSEFCGAAKKLHGRTMSEAVAGFMQTAVTVVPKDIGEAVTDFLVGSEHLTHSSDGKRAQLSTKYAYVRALQLRRFADTLAGHAVCDLTKAHLDTFISELGEQKTKSRNHRKIDSAKSRNHYRGVIRQFLAWCARKDYLSQAHRLFEAEAMRPELANTAEIEFYTPDEFKRLLEVDADDLLPLRPLIAIGGFAGLRTAELLRLDWADVWRIPGHIEITARKAKTRQRRLVEICPALAGWLETHRANKSGKLWTEPEGTFQKKFVELCEKAKAPRKHNGLRHSFCTYHFAKDSNENMTAAQAGNSPAMIHGHYKGLATKADAEKWFTVTPA